MDVATAAVVGLIVGAIAGLAPLIAGYFRSRLALGVIGFVASVVGGAILGLLLAVPVALVFTLVILLVRREPTAAREA